ncbi:hypothetical protein ACJX0J_042269 [Zea mays]
MPGNGLGYAWEWVYICAFKWTYLGFSGCCTNKTLKYDLKKVNMHTNSYMHGSIYTTTTIYCLCIPITFSLMYMYIKPTALKISWDVLSGLSFLDTHHFYTIMFQKPYITHAGVLLTIVPFMVLYAFTCMLFLRFGNHLAYALYISSAYAILLQ